ncbi:hypothetical protein DFS33DRAFT_305976 [Desarmillaria ectypa]|nr:hypothetical protein DFS33DRAFT_305976 [Desarmillaria ectypa]
MGESSLKRKRPPTFPHHPAARAKKLKQEWVFKAKIKSKWKAEKRKMAAVSAGDDKDMQDVDSDSGASSKTQEDSKENQQLSLEPPAPPSCTKSVTQKSTVPEQTISSRPPVSVREIKRTAYSKSTLHSYKADPFNKRKSGSVRGQSFKGDHDRNGNRGRGQPNMKLRMNAMLEKIKRDLV